MNMNTVGTGAIQKQYNLLFHFCADIAYILKMKWFNLIVRANFSTDFQRVKLNANELEQKTSLYKHFLVIFHILVVPSLVVLELIQKQISCQGTPFPFLF